VVRGGQTLGAGSAVAGSLAGITRHIFSGAFLSIPQVPEKLAPYVNLGKITLLQWL